MVRIVGRLVFYKEDTMKILEILDAENVITRLTKFKIGRYSRFVETVDDPNLWSFTLDVPRQRWETLYSKIKEQVPNCYNVTLG